MTISEVNQLPLPDLKETLFKCCGSTQWVQMMVETFPLPNEEMLLSEAEKKWSLCSKEDWLEAFSCHPKIGDIESLQKKYYSTKDWTLKEQAGVNTTSPEVLQQLSDYNKLYEENFGYIFIVCATGKTAEEMLELLKKRLHSRPEDELFTAMREQNKITLLRLQKLLSI